MLVSSTTAESLTEDFFFEYPNLIELYLTDKGIANLPISISQCALLQKVDISGTSLLYPPAILFTVPALRIHPENILFGNGEKCTRELMCQILQNSARIAQRLITFVRPNGQKSRVNISSEVSVREFICLMEPRFSEFIDDLMLRRTIGDTKKHTTYELFIPPSDIALSMYWYPTNESYTCEFSVEFKVVPKDFRTFESGIELFKKFVRRISSLAAYNNYREELQMWIVLTNTGRVSEIDANSDKLSHLYFNVETSSDHLTIVATQDGIKVIENDTFGYFVDPESLRLTLLNDVSLILHANDRAYEITISDDISNLFKICQTSECIERKVEFDFASIGTQAKTLANHVKNGTTISETDLDALRSVHPQYFGQKLASTV